MSSKELFGVGVRFLGLYLLVQAAETLLSSVLMGPMIVGTPDAMSTEGSSILQLFVASVLAKGCLGYFFLCYAHRLVVFVWAAEEAETKQPVRDSSAT